MIIGVLDCTQVYMARRWVDSAGLARPSPGTQLSSSQWQDFGGATPIHRLYVLLGNWSPGSEATCIVGRGRGRGRACGASLRGILTILKVSRALMSSLQYYAQRLVQDPAALPEILLSPLSYPPQCVTIQVGIAFGLGKRSASDARLFSHPRNIIG